MVRSVKYLKWINRRLLRIRFFWKALILRIIGVEVDWSASVHWSAVIEPGVGEISIGPRTSIDRGVILRSYGGAIKIGSDCSINPYSVLYGDGGLYIGNGVRIAAHTVIVPAKHNYSDRSKSIIHQGESRRGITIKDDVWIGAGARILDGVTISKGCVIGAGAVVTNSTEAYTVCAGVPARKISERV